MHVYTIFLAFAATATAITALVMFFRLKAVLERSETDHERQHEAMRSMAAPEVYENLSKEYVDLYRLVSTGETKVESLSLQVNELRDLVERRYHQLRMKIYRDVQEGGADEDLAIATPESQLLLEDLGQGPGEDLQPEQVQPPRRRRLVRMSGRGYKNR